MDGNVLYKVESFIYARVTFSGNAKWNNHVEETLRKPLVFEKKLRRLSTPDQFVRKLAEACIFSIVHHTSSLVYFNTTLLFLDTNLSSSVMHLVFQNFKVSKIVFAKVTPRHPLTLGCGLLEFISTECIRTTPPPSSLQSAALENCCVPEVCPSGTVSTSV